LEFMKKEDTAREVLFGIVIFIIVVLSIKGLITLASFIGYFSYLDSKAGTISELDIRINFDVSHWNAIYGTAWGVGFGPLWQFNMSGNNISLNTFNNEKHLIFLCLEPKKEHELYASMVPQTSINFFSLQAATPADYDAYMGIPSSSFYSASNTFIYTATFHVGANYIVAPATHTYRYGVSNATEFVTGILKDSSGHLVLVTKIFNEPIDGYNLARYNYQILLPIQNGSSQVYDVWSDPTDDCPAGFAEIEFTGWVYGKVTDTTGNPLDAIIEVAGKANVSNASTGEYFVGGIPEGNYSIYAFKTGYQVYRGNVVVTRNNGTLHNIVMIISTPPTPPVTGVGPGIDLPGDQVETGKGPGQRDESKKADFDTPPVLQRPQRIEGTDYIISISEINRKLRLGNFLQEKITLYSFKEKAANILFRLEGNITGIVKLDKESMILAPRTADFVTLTIFGVGEVGIYNGSLILEGDFNASIPINIEILERDKAPVETLLLDLDLTNKIAFPGQEIRFKTDMKNLLTDQQYSVALYYTIQDLEGKNTLWSHDTNAFIRTSVSLINSVKIPKDAKPGDYVLRASASYLGLSSATSQILRIETPWYLVTIAGKLRIWHLILILVLLSIAATIIYDVRRRIEAKKKFHIKVEQGELPKPGGRSIWVGKIAETDTKTYFNMESFMTHCIDAGSTGSGKSVSAQVIVEEMLDKGVAVICFDPTAQWTGMLRKCTDKTMLALYPYFGMTPKDAKAFNGNIRMITNPREVIDIKQYVKPGEINIFACHKLEPKDMDIFVANSIRQIFRANFGENRTLKVLFVYDEVHRLLPKFGGSGEGFLQIERGCREFRKWGLGVLLISQVLSDFVGTIKANINTEIQMRTRDEGDLERIRVKYGEEVLRSLVKATVGSGMVENPQYNRGKPYFIAFKPLRHSVQRLSDEEIEKYNEYNENIDQVQFELEELEKAGVDVFDLKLELKLALDKVKSGSFNMVQIYIEGLLPRLKKHWEKLGRQAPKLEKKLISDSEMKADLEKAKEAREAYEAEQKKSKPAIEGEAKEVDLYKKDVNPEKILKLVNGMLVINMASLYDEIAAMKDDDYSRHINFEKNEFADWVKYAVGDAELGELLRYTIDKNQILGYLELRKGKKPLPKLDETITKKYNDARDAYLAEKKRLEEERKKKEEKNKMQAGEVTIVLDDAQRAAQLAGESRLAQEAQAHGKDDGHGSGQTGAGSAPAPAEAKASALENS
jgi:hypothetical protein